MNATFIFIKSFDSVLEVVSQSAISSSILEGLINGIEIKKKLCNDARNMSVFQYP